MDFFSELENRVGSAGSCLCVGLDPRVDPAAADPGGAILAANRRVIEATAPFAASFKPNLAFYEAFGPAGMSALEETLAAIPRDIPVILDAKRCDIDATAEAYARALFGRLGAGAVTLSPYMGRDAVDPFLKYPGRGVFLLCRTSNPGAGAFQDLIVARPAVAAPAPASPGGGLAAGTALASPETLFLRVARECTSWSPSVGLVVAGNDIAALRAVRAAAPRAWFLSPGVGAQGGRADEAFSAGARGDGAGILVVAARSVAEAADPGAAAKRLRDDMAAARRAAAEPSRRGVPGFGAGLGAGAAPVAAEGGDPGLAKRLIRALVDTGCFKLGDFTLKSGKRSPFYIDLRRLVSDPAALSVAAEAYEAAARGLTFDRVAGIPAAALPLATAACLRMGAPMVWPRMPAKEHGTGNRVEGDYAAGDRLLLLDDLITTGASKLEAIEILRGESLVVEDLVVLVERGKQGRRDMAEAGVALRAFLHVRELFAVCEELGLVDAGRRKELEDFVDAE